MRQTAVDYGDVELVQRMLSDRMAGVDARVNELAERVYAVENIDGVLGEMRTLRDEVAALVAEARAATTVAADAAADAIDAAIIADAAGETEAAEEIAEEIAEAVIDELTEAATPEPEPAPPPPTAPPDVEEREPSRRGFWNRKLFG